MRRGASVVSDYYCVSNGAIIVETPWISEKRFFKIFDEMPLSTATRGRMRAAGVASRQRKVVSSDFQQGRGGSREAPGENGAAARLKLTCESRALVSASLHLNIFFFMFSQPVESRSDETTTRRVFLIEMCF